MGTCHQSYSTLSLYHGGRHVGWGRFCSDGSNTTSVWSAYCFVGCTQAGELDFLQTHDVRGLYMRNWDSSDELGSQACPADEDEASARQVAEHIGIPLEVASFERQYWTDVFEPFIARYEKGLTPNPDVDCNKSVKFGHLLQYCLRNSKAAQIATGHYCTVAHSGSEHHTAACAAVTASKRAAAHDLPLLLRGVDPIKDQSYFLCAVPPSALAHVHTPLGTLHKSQVRKLAQEAHLPNAHRKDSYGICFVGKRKLPDWLPQYMPLTSGQLVCVDSGKVLRETSGVQLWTEGQGARVGGMSQRYVVVGKNVAAGCVLVAPGARHPSSLSQGLVIPFAAFNFQAPAEWLLAPLLGGAQVQVRLRIRHRQDTLIPATVHLSDAGEWRHSYPSAWLPLLVDGSCGEPVQRRAAACGASCGSATQDHLHMVVKFHSPQQFVSPGQIAAMYDAATPVCLGGGGIAARGVNASAFSLLKPDKGTAAADGVALMP